MVALAHEKARFIGSNIFKLLLRGGQSFYAAYQEGMKAICGCSQK